MNIKKKINSKKTNKPSIEQISKITQFRLNLIREQEKQ